jgi:hypothetical protein
MKKFSGIDLHSNNSVVVVSDEVDHIVYQRPNCGRHANVSNGRIDCVARPSRDRVGVKTATQVPGERPLARNPRDSLCRSADLWAEALAVHVVRPVRGYGCA